MSRRSLRGWLALAPVVFLLHDAEEVATVARWTRENGHRLPGFVQPYLPVRTEAFAVGVALLLAVFVAAALAATRRRAGRAARLACLVLVGGLLANGATHLGQAALLRGYVPGVVTAALLVVPYGLLTLRAAVRAGEIGRRAALALFWGGLLLQVPAALAVLAAAGVLRR